jgi:hypothetical protein
MFKNPSLALMAHAYNHNYSGGRDQKDRGSKQPYPEKTHHIKGLVEWLTV